MKMTNNKKMIRIRRIAQAAVKTQKVKRRKISSQEEKSRRRKEPLTKLLTAETLITFSD